MIDHQRNREAEQPFEYPSDGIVVRFPFHQEGMSDAEAQLKRQLAELHREYQQRADPIIRQLCKIESMRPPRPMVIDASMIDPAMLAQLQRNTEK